MMQDIFVSLSFGLELSDQGTRSSNSNSQALMW